MTTHRYSKVELPIQQAGNCPVCRKRVTRSTTFWQTESPFNKNADGEPKNRDEIWQALRAEAANWTPDFTHWACRGRAMADTRYERSRDGKVVHVAGCKHAGSAVPWHYSAGRDAADLRAEIERTPWLRCCLYCWPKADDAPACCQLDGVPHDHTIDYADRGSSDA